MRTNCKYMKGREFKERQFWLPFVDAVGVVLQIMEEAKAEAAGWFKSWVKSFRTPKMEAEQQQMMLPLTCSITEDLRSRKTPFWAMWTEEKNIPLFS